MLTWFCLSFVLTATPLTSIQLLSLTPIGLPPELQRYRQGSNSRCGFDDRTPEEEPVRDGVVVTGFFPVGGGGGAVLQPFFLLF